MQLARPASALDPRSFGRGPRKHFGPIEAPPASTGSDLRLFATTFAAGFVFVSVFFA